MSVLFPKLNKPRGWDYRPIYYDADKEARKDKLARLRQKNLREQMEQNRPPTKMSHVSRLTFWLSAALGVLLVYLFITWYF
ncbi:MAG: hypothetical protein IJS00_00790 [Paludibacteraceae bacterium]|nr:hypothetical protein [Paludibacteraceae bacterium]